MPALLTTFTAISSWPSFTVRYVLGPEAPSAAFLAPAPAALPAAASAALAPAAASGAALASFAAAYPSGRGPYPHLFGEETSRLSERLSDIL